MRVRLTLFLLTAILIPGVSFAQDEEESDLLKKVREALNGVDVCETDGLYNDGTCDTICWNEDPDCNRDIEIDNEDICEEMGWYGDGNCQIQCPKRDPDCPSSVVKQEEEKPYDECEEKGFYGDGVCDKQCLKEDTDCLFEPVEVEKPGSCTEETPVRCPSGACKKTFTECFVIPKPRSRGSTTQSGSTPVAREKPVDAMVGSGEVFERIYTPDVIEENDMDEFVKDLVNTIKAIDPSITSVQQVSDTIHVSVSRQAKVFGFIPKQYEMTISIFPGGHTTHVPWWLKISTNNAEEFAENLVERILAISL